MLRYPPSAISTRRTRPYEAPIQSLLVAGLISVGLQLSVSAQLVPDGGTLEVTTFTNLPGNFTVGQSAGSTTLNMIAPGVVNNGIGTIGNGRSSGNNTITVQNAGAIWNNSGMVDVGNLGVGNQLIISGGGTVSNTNGTVGDHSGANRAIVHISSLTHQDDPIHGKSAL